MFSSYFLLTKKEYNPNIHIKHFTPVQIKCLMFIFVIISLRVWVNFPKKKKKLRFKTPSKHYLISRRRHYIKFKRKPVVPKTVPLVDWMHFLTIWFTNSAGYRKIRATHEIKTTHITTFRTHFASDTNRVVFFR